MKNKKVSIIVPNWNGKKLLELSLGSLGKQTFKDFEIIVVDNASSDDSVEFIKAKFPDTKIIQHNKNLGFAAAINAAARYSESKYIALLNNDTEVDKDWLLELVKCAEKNPQAASICSKLLNFDNRNKIDGVGILVNEVGQARSIGWEETDEGQFNLQMPIFGATGGAALFNRNTFIKVGMFDEHYFMYSEEVDWAFRAQFLGYQSLFCPKSVVYHKHKATSGKMTDMLEYWQFKNMYMTIIKDYPTSLLLKRWRLLKIILVYFNTIFYQLRNGFIWPPFAVTGSLIINLPYLLGQRKKIQSNRKVSDEYIESFLAPKPVTLWGILK